MPYTYQIVIDYNNIGDFEGFDGYITLKPLPFPNPISKGDTIHVRGYGLGIVEDLFHVCQHWADGISKTMVFVNPGIIGGGDAPLFLYKYRGGDSELTDLVETFDDNLEKYSITSSSE